MSLQFTSHVSRKIANPNNEIGTKVRIKYIDALRGFTMILVVIQHILVFTFGIQPYDTVFSNIFVTFRMPMFFFISGYIAYKASTVWNRQLYVSNIKKKAMVQLIPTVFFFSLFCFSNYQNPVCFFIEYGLSEYWFTFVLFEMFFIFYSVSILNKKYFDGIIVTLSVAGIIILVFMKQDTNWWTWLCMKNLCKYFQFFALGLIAKKYNDKFLSIIKNDLFKTFIIIAFILCIILITRTAWGTDSFIGKNIIRSILIRYFGLLVVFSFFVSKEKFFIKENKFNSCLQFIGRRTLDIYLIHYFLIPPLQENMTTFVSGSFITEAMVSTLVALIIVGMCLLISEVIRSSNLLGHYLLGAKQIN